MIYWSLWGIASLALLFLLIAIIWSIRRHRDVSLRVDCGEGIEQFLPSLAGLTLGTSVPGNSVELLENGRYFDVLLGRIRAAEHSVHFETFLWKDCTVGRALAAALAERARTGCQVRVLLDANGAAEIGPATVRQMRAAGCKVAFFHDGALRNIGLLNERDHRKLVVIDGREAFVGGHCIVDTWLGNAQDRRFNADVSVRVRGPIVNTLQGVFSENWIGETTELFGGDGYFPRLPRTGDACIHAAYLKPEGSAPAVKILHHVAICLARARIRIQNPYFIPQPAAIDALGEAVNRGVDVRVLMPSTSGSDNPMVQHAGHRNFEKLLRCGVRLFEYPHTLLHQKVMTIDGVWSAVGSSNFDDRSFETNDELTLGILDRDLAGRLDAIFDRYVARADEVDLHAWHRRGAWHKLKDNTFYLFHELL
ncbi:phospholipase D-like domain-containing protein [Ramlibacter sp.]|uniref:phospholipase D-like domain-containing protein n=1 Tax=Ramlibacter sp. TaxID=1917967 RepID=UPI002C43F504|nr:phospholipase D-like domain-containing protein [Ramlibacter sp.]HWI82284.1 phospholipase D-like domain-containing protein [Ramlibacter sp.]